MLTVEEIQEFLKERPLLTQRGLSLEAGVSDSVLGKVLRHDRELTEEFSNKLEPVLRKYGFQKNR